MSFVRTERQDQRGRNTAWLVVRVDLARAVLTMRAPRHDRLETLMEDPSVVMAVNGGFFEMDGSPSGLLISAGLRLGAWRPHAGSGVLVVAGGHARVVPSAEVREAEGAELAIQCGPRLVEPDGTVGVHSDDGKRAARTVACVRGQGGELDVVLAWTRNSDRDGPGLLEMAHWLVAPLVAGDSSGCEAALNLDGGPSTGVVLRGLAEELRKPFGPVPWALTITESPR